MHIDVTILCGGCKSKDEEIAYVANGLTNDSTLTY